MLYSIITADAAVFRYWYFFCLLRDPAAALLPRHVWSELVDLDKWVTRR